MRVVYWLAYGQAARPVGLQLTTLDDLSNGHCDAVLNVELVQARSPRRPIESVVASGLRRSNVLCLIHSGRLIGVATGQVLPKNVANTLNLLEATITADAWKWEMR